MLSQLGELLGDPPAPALPEEPVAVLQQAAATGWAPAPQQAAAPVTQPPEQPPWQPRQQQAGPAQVPEPRLPANFMQRNSERLGGQGVASLLAGG